jgi:hypothetical protein
VGLEEIGHLVRIYHVRVVKKIFESKREERRGRQRLRWQEDIVNDLREKKFEKSNTQQWTKNHGRL